VDRHAAVVDQHRARAAGHDRRIGGSVSATAYAMVVGAAEVVGAGEVGAGGAAACQYASAPPTAAIATTTASTAIKVLAFIAGGGRPRPLMRNPVKRS